LAACSARRPPGRGIVFLADREGDLYDLVAWERPPGVDLLIRGDGRRLDGASRLLGAVLADAAVLATGGGPVPRRGGRAGRTAGVDIRVRPVRLAVPGTGPRRGRRGPPAVTAVQVAEAKPPAGVAPVRWLRLTTLAVADAAAAWQVVRYYTRRWRVEQYHFTLKSGCAVEWLQLETRARLERALAVYTVVAVRLLRLTYLARHRPQQSCEAEFGRPEGQGVVGAGGPEVRGGGGGRRAPRPGGWGEWGGRGGAHAGRRGPWRGGGRG